MLGDGLAPLFSINISKAKQEYDFEIKTLRFLYQGFKSRRRNEKRNSKGVARLKIIKGKAATTYKNNLLHPRKA